MVDTQPSPDRFSSQEYAGWEEVELWLDADVLAAFKATGKGWQTRIDDALNDWLKTHSPA